MLLVTNRTAPRTFNAADLEGGIQITAKWYDDLGRLEDVVTYGTYGGSDFDRDALSVPASSDTALRTTYAFESDGDLQVALLGYMGLWSLETKVSLICRECVIWNSPWSEALS